MASNPPMIKYLRCLLVYAVLLFFVSNVFAAVDVQTYPYSLSTYNTTYPLLTAGNSISINDIHYDEEHTGSTASEYVSLYTQKVRLAYTHEKRSDIGSLWTAQVVIEISDAIHTKICTLNIGTTGQVIYSDESKFDLQGKNIVVTVISTNFAGVSNAVYSDIRLEVDLIKERHRDIQAWAGGGLGVKANGNELTAYWKFVDGAEQYELQWVYIDELDQNYATITAANIFNHQTLTSTTTYDRHYKEPVNVVTGEQYYNIYNSYSTGKLFFRVRALGNHIHNVGSDYTHVQYGEWSDVMAYEINDGFEPLHNWQYSVSYAEGGKNKRVVSYADGSLRGRETLASLSTEERTVVGAQEYDFEGRPSLSIVPVPVDGIDLSPKPLFNRKNANDPYIKSDYDANFPSNTLIPPLDINFGSAKYYSENNTMAMQGVDYIPDAQGYPLVQTIYTKDGTGRVAKAGGIGPDHQIGSGRETKYFYGNTNETELRRLFGSNVGNAVHYKKNITVDPNGQVSVSYLDQEGRTIATGLAGLSPDNVVSLGATTTPIIASLNASNVLNKEDRISSSVNKITNTVPNTEYTFKYDFTGVINALGEPFEMCLTCSYTLDISIADPQGRPVTFRDEDNSADVTLLTREFKAEDGYDCTPPYFGPQAANFKVTFPEIGQYTVTKVLRMTDGQLDAYMENVGNGSGYPDVEQIYDDFIAGINYALCALTCEQHYRKRCYVDLGLSITTDYSTLTAAQKADVDNCVNTYCLSDANTPIAEVKRDECESLLGQMKNDIYPTGYVWYTPNLISTPGVPTISNTDGSIIVSVTDILNATVTDNSSDFLENHSTAAGAPDYVRFEQWMADALVPYHREYCHYTFCIANSIPNTLFVPPVPSSAEYDVHMMMTNSFETAINTTINWQSRSFIDLAASDPDNGPFGTSGDPFFATGAPGNAMLTDMNNELANWNGSGLSLLEFTAPPAPSSVSTPPPYIGFSNGIYGGTVPPNIATPVTDADYRQAGFYSGMNWSSLADVNKQHWSLWRGMYQGLKQRIMADFNETNNSCPYYDDAYNIVNDPRTVPMDWGSVNSYITDHLSNFIEDACQANLVSWKYILEDHCGPIAPATWALIEQKLKLYCRNNSGVTNPTGQILSSHITTDPLLIDVNALLYPCSIPSTMISDPGATSPPGYQISVVDPCLRELLDFVSAHSPINVGQSFNASTLTSSLISCLPSGGPVKVIVNSGDNILAIGSTESDICAYILLDENGITIPWSDISSNGILSATIEPCSTCTTVNPAYINVCLRIQTSTGVKKVFLHKYSTGNDTNCKIPTTAVRNIGDPPTTSPPDYSPDDAQQDCIDALIAETNFNAVEHWKMLVDEYTNKFRATTQKCFETPFAENFYVSYSLLEYQYTLYYYDQAGNLVQTVPPQGVDLTGAEFNAEGKWNTATEPAHTLLTRYRYNSLEKVMEQVTPDAGNSKFYYDSKGQLKLSQNAKQVALGYNGSYSISQYDELGRVTLVGQVTPSVPLPSPITRDLLDQETYPDNISPYASEYSEITKTDYNRATLPAYPGFSQQNLRGKVAVSMYADSYADLNNGKATGVYYSYDVHGNVKDLLNYTYSAPTGYSAYTMPVKHTNYGYDLISGKVNRVTYQPGQPDMFIHRYEYDADNRITNVYTSSDNMVWHEDAQYFYLAHGPLARIELGQDKVQGLDYYYNLQGWLKGMNITGNNAANDIGKDGSTTGALATNNLNKWFGKDELRFALGYYEGDYKPIHTTDAPLGAAATSNTWSAFSDLIKKPSGTLPIGFKHGLFNGNITWMITDIPGLGQAPLSNAFPMQAMVYQYDQLNRIKHSRRNNTYDNYTAPVWTVRGSSTIGQAYDEDYSYDKNGNILSLQRVGQGTLLIDNLAYNYNTAVNNRLLSVDDGEPTDGTTNACGNKQAPDITNGNHPFEYDDIGNLISDEKEEIEEITWTVYGKIKEIKRTACSSRPWIRFLYDPTGNRIAKIVDVQKPQKDWLYTYYQRDASGNTMATYEKKYEEITTSTFKEKITLNEQPIYGSSRVGSYNAAKLVAEHDYELNTTTPYNSDNTFASPTVEETEEVAVNDNYKRILKLRVYELSNHLGNVLATVSDHKVGHDTNSDDLADYYMASVVSAQDYYPFGSVMPNRTIEPALGEKYRYGFNGKEKDDEIKNVDGSSLDFEARVYDSRLARWASIDKIYKPGITPYHFVSNNPITRVDEDGNTDYYFIKTVYVDAAGDSKLQGTTSSDVIIVQNSAPDRFFYLQETVVTDANGEITSQVNKNTQFFPFSQWHSSGISESGHSFLGISWTTDDTDREAMAKIINGNKSFWANRNYYGNAQYGASQAQWSSLLNYAEHGFKEEQRNEAFVTFGLELLAMDMLVSSRFLSIEEFSTMGEKGFVSPYKIRFSQNNVGANFRDGGSLTQMTKDLKSGTLKAMDVKPIRIVEKDGQIYTLDNRRLKVFQDAGFPIRYEKVKFNPTKHQKYFSTTNNGTSIEVR